LRPGEVIAGRFEIVRSVRSGGLSVVFQAVDRKTSETVAVKVINIQPSEEALLKRIDREIKILSSLSHPHVVGCIGAGALPDGRPYLVLEWLEGEDLADFKVRAPMTLRRVLEVLGQVADALAAAHTLGIIHRDIKPANIYMVHPSADSRPDCRVLDFGVAKMPQANAGITRAGAILGTPSYMAPEQASYAMDVDARADVFSLGVVAFEILTGKLPWQSTTDLARLARILVEPAMKVHEVSPDVPPSVAELIDHTLKLKVNERIATAREVHDRVVATLEDLPDAILDTVFTRDAELLSSFVREDTADIPVPERDLKRSMLRIPSVKDLRTEGMVLGPGGYYPILESKQLVGVADIRDARELREAREARHSAKHAKTPTRATEAALPRSRSMVTEAHPAPDIGPLNHEVSAKELSEPTQLFENDSSTVPPARPKSAPEVVPLSPVVSPPSRPISRGRSAKKRAFDETLSYVDTQDNVLFGRVQELDALRSATTRPLNAGRPSFILVYGPAGIGKTRVRVELTRMLKSTVKPPRVLAGRAEEVAQSSPYSFLRRVLSAEARIHSDDTPDRKRSKMLELLPNAVETRGLLDNVEPALPHKARGEDEDDAALEDHDTIAAFVSRALHVPYHNNASYSLAERDPRLMGDQVRRAFDVILRHLASKKGLVVLVDDAHFLDFQSAQVLRELVRPERGQPIVVMAFALPQILDGEGSKSPLAGVHSKSMEIEPLDARASREFARSLVKGSLESSALELLVKRASGNPLYLEQLVLAVQANGALSLAGGGEYELRGMTGDRTDDDRVPPTVAAAVAARITNMRHPLQKALTTAAVFGDVFWVEGVAGLLDEGLDETTVLLDNLVLANLVRRRQGTRYRGQLEMEFTHGVIRSVALSKVKRRRRHKLEKMAVAYFESVGEADRAMLALHVAHSGRTDKAAKLFCDAAEDSLSIGAIASAGTLADEGMLLTESSTDEGTIRQRLLEVAERVAMLSSDHDTALSVIDQLESLAVSDHDRARLIERRAAIAFTSRRLVDSAQLAEAALEKFQALGSEEYEARARVTHAEASEALRDGKKALRGYIGAHAVFAAKHELPGLVRTTRGLARIAIYSGDYRTAENRFKESLVHAQTLGDRDAIFCATMGLCEVALLVGDEAGAAARIDEAAVYTEHLDRHLLCETRKACLYFETGRAKEAIEVLERALAAAEQKSSLLPVAWTAALHLGRVAASVEDAPRDTVKKHLFLALAAASGAAPILVPALEMTLALVEAANGNPEEAVRLASEGVRRFTEEGAIAEEEPPRMFAAQARVLSLADEGETKIRAAWKSAVEQIDRIASRLDRKLRNRYLDRASIRAILEAAEGAGLKLSRDASTYRIAASE
jgi:serine/threonine protein kinase/tetratricopeptide (TPR) repeat protein